MTTVRRVSPLGAAIGLFVAWAGASVGCELEPVSVGVREVEATSVCGDACEQPGKDPVECNAWCEQAESCIASCSERGGDRVACTELCSYGTQKQLECYHGCLEKVGVNAELDDCNTFCLGDDCQGKCLTDPDKQTADCDQICANIDDCLVRCKKNEPTLPVACNWVCWNEYP